MLALIFIVPYVRRIRRREQAVLKAQEESVEMGLFRPASLHPVVDASQCIGTGNCIEVCPEKDVLGLLSGQAKPVSPARCIGHGLCERACPVDAIQLVFGTARRGVELPRIQENFETNVSNLFVVGELGGMGLIRNAFEQGKQCLDGIAGKGDTDILDVVIVGCGPAGLSAAIHASSRKMKYVVLEKDCVGGTVLSYPRKKLVMTAPVDLPGQVRMDRREYNKEELLALWKDIVEEFDLNIHEHEVVHSIFRSKDGVFTVQSGAGSYRAFHVILAIGRRGVPRKLDVPGEIRSTVSYALGDPARFRGDRVLVVGGGDSAVEAALSLSEEEGTSVLLSYRKDTFSRIKQDNRGRLDAAVQQGRIALALGTQVSEFRDGEVVLAHTSGSETVHANDYSFVLIGGTLPTAFLSDCGIKIDTVFGARSRSRRKANG